MFPTQHWLIFNWPKWKQCAHTLDQRPSNGSAHEGNYEKFRSLFCVLFRQLLLCHSWLFLLREQDLILSQGRRNGSVPLLLFDFCRQRNSFSFGNNTTPTSFTTNYTLTNDNNDSDNSKLNKWTKGSGYLKVACAKLKKYRPEIPASNVAVRLDLDWITVFFSFLLRDREREREGAHGCLRSWRALNSLLLRCELGSKRSTQDTLGVKSLGFLPCPSEFPNWCGPPNCRKLKESCSYRESFFLKTLEITITDIYLCCQRVPLFQECCFIGQRLIWRKYSSVGGKIPKF